MEYDSEESQGSDDEDDDEEEDVYVSETQLQEHSNPNSYRYLGEGWEFFNGTGVCSSFAALVKKGQLQYSAAE